MSDNPDVVESAGLATIPQELIDAIVDLLRDDKGALRACSLVHRKLLSATSSHLFGRLSWPPCGLHWKHRGVANYCRCSHILDNTETLACLRSLLMSSARIRHNVRELRIAMTPKGTPACIELSTSPQEVVDIIDLLPRMHSLTLRNAKFIPEASLALCPNTNRILRNLRLEWFNPNVQFHQIVSFLSYFRRISTLSIENAQLISSVTHAPFTPPVLPIMVVDNLELCFPLTTGSRQYWPDRVCTYFDGSQIKSLTVQDDERMHLNNAPAAGLHRLLQRCTTLRTLTCRRGVFSALLSYPARCPTLRELRFEDVGTRTSTIPVPWMRLADVMDSRLGSTVQSLVFRWRILPRIEEHQSIPSPEAFWAAFEMVLDGSDWTPLANVIERIGTLRSLTIHAELEVVKRTGMVDKDGKVIAWPVRLSWAGDEERYFAKLENVAKSRLPPAAHDQLHLRVSFISLDPYVAD